MHFNCNQPFYSIKEFNEVTSNDFTCHFFSGYYFLINAAGTVCESNDFSTWNELGTLMTLEVKLADYWISQLH